MIGYRRIIGVAALTLVAAGCMGLSVLPNGVPSVMNGQYNAMRAAVPVKPVRFNGPLVYQPVKGCAYQGIKAVLGEQPRTFSMNVAVKPLKKAKDRLLVVTTASDGDNSTALIGTDGKLYDYSQMDAKGVGLVTPETFERQAQEKLSNLRTQRLAVNNAHVIRPVTLVIPEYAIGTPDPGDVVSTITAERDVVWARYIYRGVTVFRGRNAIVLDLMRSLGAAPGAGEVLFGYDIVDATTLMPLSFRLDAGTRTEFDISVCTP